MGIYLSLYFPLLLFLSLVSLQGAPGEAGMSIIGPRGPPVSGFSLFLTDAGCGQVTGKDLEGAVRHSISWRAKTLYNVVPVLSQAWFYTAIIYYI